MICGGNSEAQQPTQEIIQLVSNLSSQIQGLNANYEVVSFTSQYTAGVNYTVTIRNGDHSLSVSIYQPPSGEASVTEVVMLLSEPQICN